MLEDSQSEMSWYVVHVRSRFEAVVEKALRERVAHAALEDCFGRVLVPTEEVVETRSGQKRVTERRFYPGYILIEMVLSDKTWHLVRTTPKVSGFIGGTGNRPVPLSKKEVERIIKIMSEGAERPRPKTLFEVGEVVRIKEGPFADFDGCVDEVNYDKSRLRLSVSIFGRSAPVELAFSQVEKI